MDYIGYFAIGMFVGALMVLTPDKVVVLKHSGEQIHAHYLDQQYLLVKCSDIDCK